MGLASSADEVNPSFFEDLLINDIKLNDPICKTILTSKPLSKKVFDSQIVEQINIKKPNNVRVLIYQSIFSISRIAQLSSESEFPQALLISCYNSYLLMQRFGLLCYHHWNLWPSPSNLTGTLPTILFQSSFALLNHQCFMSSNNEESFYYQLRCEIVHTLFLFLFWDSQEPSDIFPNVHFSALNQSNPKSLFRTIFNGKPGINDDFRRLSYQIISSGIAFCPVWTDLVSQISFVDIYPVFEPLLSIHEEDQLSLSNISIQTTSHELYSLLYQVLLNHPDAIESLPKGKAFIVSILYALQIFNEKVSLCYFHSIALSTLVLLTSDSRLSSSLNDPFTSSFQCRSSVHRGSHADLLIEIITNTIGNDISQTIPLLPAIACIIHNISSHVKSFSFFTCNRIFRFLQLLIESKDKQASRLMQIVVDGLVQILHDQFSSNINILMFTIKHFKTFKYLKTLGLNVDYLITFIEAFKSKAKDIGASKMGTDEAESVLRTMKPELFMGDYEPPGPRGHIFTGEMAELWSDWMRTISAKHYSCKSIRSKK